ncbi:hypothetical protein BST61_g6186 [Cercospora zeina]
MHNTKLIFALLAAATCAVKGQELDLNDIPQECQSTCQALVEIENRCDQQFENYNNNNRNQGNNGQGGNQVNNGQGGNQANNGQGGNQVNNGQGGNQVNNGQGGYSPNQQFRNCVCQDQNAAQALSSCIECIARTSYYPTDIDDDYPWNYGGPGQGGQQQGGQQQGGQQQGGQQQGGQQQGGQQQGGQQQGGQQQGQQQQSGREGEGQSGNNNYRGQAAVDREIVEWARICGIQVPGFNGTGPYPTNAPTGTYPRVTVTGSTTVVQTLGCNDLNNPYRPDGDDNDRNSNEPQCTRTTVVPLYGTITSGFGPTGVSISYTTSIGTDVNGQTRTFTRGIPVATGAAGVPAEAVSFFGAGAAALVAAFAL